MKKIIFLGFAAVIIGLASVIVLNSLSNKPNAISNVAQNNLLPVTATSSPESNISDQNIPTNISTNKKMTKVVLKTSKGNIELELLSTAPLAADNFRKLVSQGFYDGIKFHRVIESFMIQAGDPQSKDDNLKSLWGTGGPGYKFKDELTGEERYPQGTLAMANSGPNTNGSQFFIVTGKNVQLPPNYTVFGKVIAGMDVALLIESVPRDNTDKPIESVVIQKATLE